MIVIDSLDFTHFINSVIGHTEVNFFTEIIQIRAISKLLMVADKIESTSVPIAAKCGIDTLILCSFVCPADNLCVVSEHIGTLLPLYVAIASIGTGNCLYRHR